MTLRSMTLLPDDVPLTNLPQLTSKLADANPTDIVLVQFTKDAEVGMVLVSWLCIEDDLNRIM